MADDEQEIVVNTNKSSGTILKWDNPNHQLYLHHSDQPGAILVHQSLVEDNYNTWKQSMNMALTVKNKVGFIDGSIKEPDEKKDPEEHQQLGQNLAPRINV